MFGDNLTMNEANTNENSELSFKLSIRGRGFEISTEGPLSLISENIDAIAELVNEIQEKMVLEEEVSIEEIPSEEEVAVTPTADIPVIEPARSTMDNIRRLFSTPWGRTSRWVAEVIRALEVNAVPDNPATVSTYLRRLVRRGELRRIEKEGKWAYYKIPSEE